MPGDLPHADPKTAAALSATPTGGNTPLPDAPLLRLYRELGGEIITLGSDAHDTRYVGCAIRERQELLRQCGFQLFHHVRGRHARIPTAITRKGD